MSLNSVLKQGIAIVLGLAALGFISVANADTVKNSEVSPLIYEPQLENQRDPNQYCAKCHKLEANDSQSGGDLHFGKFLGTHLSEKNPNTGKPITCVNCHGNISEDHRRGAKDVMRFHGDIFGDKQPMYTVQEQNQVCFACHQPKKLQEKLWAHDVHAMKLPCASCHTLHPANDKMSGIPQKEQVKLCVDCHGEQQKRIEALKSPHIYATEQKDKK
ncbi:cytochrome c nitrite reductase pentaheme subunit [Pasteurella canis]|uniref:cytochrome c nitrite reductase pentaheme subunit n=1 Tax=Pasteurella canis TaxID=753 RepID=UPI001CC36E58|nr:cytochrome c nitrite reductase pentaheme subunit [Pasteurella canis]UAY76942.1 cytochrome c nitrite reductase pentaheme subunit [Pasteurella canis]